MEFGLTFCNLCLSMLMATASLVVSADTPFERGVSAFKVQNYQSALEWFKQSRREGNASAILDFNLASSYYKLGRLPEAKRYYIKSSNNKNLAALSYYNLGLIALSVNDKQAAYQAFRRSFETAQNDRLKFLAAKHLDELMAENKEKSAPDAVSGFVSFGLGHDDNVANVSDDVTTVSNKSDTYLDLFGIVNYQLSGSRRDGVYLKAGLVLTRYDDLTRYNENMFNLGIFLTQPLADWKTRLGLVYFHDSLDGDSFQQRTALQLRADKYYSKGQRLRLKYELSLYDDLDVRYAYLNGTRQRFTIENRSYLNRHSLRLGYRLETNQRDNLVSASSFFSYSPTRQSLYGSYDYMFSEKWGGQLSAEYRDSDYEDANISAGTNLGVQHDKRSRYGLTGIYRLSRDSELEIGWRHTNNRSNISAEVYDSSEVMLGISHFF